MVMMMMMSIFKAHDSMSFNAQCAEGDKRKKKKEEERSRNNEDKEVTGGANGVGRSENRWLKLRRLRNTEEESASLVVCDSAVQSLGGRVGKKLRKVTHFSGVFFSSTWNP